MLPVVFMNVFAAALFLVLAAPAKTQTCAEACEAHTRECTSMCQKKAGPRGQQPCKQACDDQTRMCAKACGGNNGSKK
jgi:hypothetical protein